MAPGTTAATKGVVKRGAVSQKAASDMPSPAQHSTSDDVGRDGVDVADLALTTAFFALSLLVTYTFYGDEWWLLPLLGVSFAVVAAMSTLVQYVAAPAGRALSTALFQAGISAKDVMKAEPDRVPRWKEQVWKLLVHTSSTLGCLYILQRYPHWWSNPESVWDVSTADAEVDALVKGFYVFQEGLWIYWGCSHVLWEERRKDHYVMLSHHIATILLVLLSFVGASHRVGILVFFVHAISDIPVDVAKLLNYQDLGNKRGFFMAETAFVITMAGWFWFRLVEFPSRVVSAAFAGPSIVCPEQWAAVVADPATNGLSAFLGADCIPWWGVNCLLLGSLFLMHIYWFWLMVRLAWGMLSGKDVADVAEEELEGMAEEAARKARLGKA